MPYDESKDLYRFTEKTMVMQGALLTAVAANASDMAGFYPKALQVFVTPGTAGPHLTILPVRNADGATIPITLNDGFNIYDAVRVRAVTAITAGVTVWRIDDQ